MFVMRNLTSNLYGTDWMEQFKLWNSSISSFCREIKNFTNEAEGLKKVLKIDFSELFSGGYGRCNKMKATFELKENVEPVLKCTLCIVKQINDELDRFEKIGVLR